MQGFVHGLAIAHLNIRGSFQKQSTPKLEEIHKLVRCCHFTLRALSLTVQQGRITISRARPLQGRMGCKRHVEEDTCKHFASQQTRYERKAVG